MSHAFHAQKRKEKYFKLAKEQNYRSRAAFKLIQLNKKFNFLGTSRACIDLCAAPGGWLQIATKYMPVNSMIIGVDILPIKPLPNVTTFVEDITTAQCRQTLKKQLHGWQVDLVLHDGAPSVAGGATWVKDSYIQTELVLHSLKLATEFLVAGGTFVTKIFRSPDYMALTWVLKQFFEKVHVTKPDASRAASSEVFAVCQGYLAPKKIDPRMFDPLHVFKRTIDDETSNKVLNVLTQKQTGKKIRPNQEGYDESLGMLLHRKCTVTEYINTANPSEILATHNEMVFSPECEMYKTHSATTEEIKILITDLKVLGKADFAQLIKWHKKLNLYKKSLEEAMEAENQMDDADGLDEVEETEIDVEALREQELDELAEKLERQARLEKKKKHELKMKEIRKLALNAQQLKERIVDEDDDELFSLKSLKNDEVLKAFRKNSIKGLDRETFMEIISTPGAEFDLGDEKDDNVTEEAADYDTLRANEIDELYAAYKKRKGIVTKIDKKRLTQSMTNEKEDFLAEADGSNADDDSEYDDDEEVDALNKAKEQYSKSKADISMLSDERKDPTLNAQRWFAQDMFGEIDIDDEAEKNMRKQLESNRKQQQQQATKRRRNMNDDTDDDDHADYSDNDDDDDDDASDSEYDYDAMDSSSTATAKQAQVNKTRSYADNDDDSDYDSDDDSDDDDEKEQEGRWLGDAAAKAAEKARKQELLLKAEAHVRKVQGMGGSSFEEVPLSDFSDDSDARAQILALGTKMLRKKDRNQIIEAAYNRYAYNDAEDLPDWFVDDEARHNRAQIPMTKDEFDKWKNYLKAIDARPIRRLAEAAARKKKGAIRKLERAKVQANSILNQDGISQEDKLRQVDKLLKTQRAKLEAKPTKVYSVSTKSGATHATKTRTKGKTITVRVDRRMKKDKKGLKRAEWRKEHRKKRKH